MSRALLRAGAGFVRRWRLLAPARAASSGTRDATEVDKFSKLASLWWDEDSAAFGALHRMNEVRVPIVVEAARAAGMGPVDLRARALDGVRVLDAGCGGGILSEALGRVGARVCGLDASAENVAAARAHAALDPAVSERVRYACALVEDVAAALQADGAAPEAAAEVAAGGPFDCVVSSEVVEHVADPPLFVRSLAGCLRPGGVLVMTTITRTPLSYATAIVAAEQLAGLVPPGTHDYGKLVRPGELAEWMRAAGLRPAAPEPIAYNPATGRWTRGGPRVAIQYALTATRPA